MLFKFVFSARLVSIFRSKNCCLERINLKCVHCQMSGRAGSPNPPRTPRGGVPTKNGYTLDLTALTHCFIRLNIVFCDLDFAFSMRIPGVSKGCCRRFRGQSYKAKNPIFIGVFVDFHWFLMVGATRFELVTSTV